MLTRYDTAPIKKLTKDAKTGFLHATNVPIARVGVFPYLKSDGSIEMEAKLPTDLLSDSAIQSANGVPVTEDHPSGMVTKDNAKQYMKGFTATNAHVDDDTVRVDMIITDAGLINDIDNGKNELSIGFQMQLDPTKGQLNGMAYDSAQRNIRINHVAVVKRGRAGHKVSLVGDSAEMVQDYQKKGQDVDTTKVRLDGADITVATGDADKVMKLDAANADNAKKVADLNEQIAKLTAERDQLKSDAEDGKKSAKETKEKADSLEKELANTKAKYEGDAFDKAVQERMDQVDAIKPYLAESYDFKGKSVKDMQVDAIKRMDSAFDAADKSDEVISAYFDGLKKNSSAVVGYHGDNSNNRLDAADSIEGLRAARANIYNSNKEGK